MHSHIPPCLVLRRILTFPRLSKNPADIFNTWRGSQSIPYFCIRVHGVANEDI